MKQFRHLEHSEGQEWVAERIAASWKVVEPIARMSLLAGNLAAKLFGDRATRAVLNGARRVVSPELLPSWMESVPMRRGRACRGLLHEQLTRSATQEEASEVAGKELDLYLCANRTCEVGMEHATRAPYESFYTRSKS